MTPQNVVSIPNSFVFLHNRHQRLLVFAVYKGWMMSPKIIRNLNKVSCERIFTTNNASQESKRFVDTFEVIHSCKSVASSRLAVSPVCVSSSLSDVHRLHGPSDGRSVYVHRPTHRRRAGGEHPRLAHQTTPS